jgi:hypothetical protein
MGIAGRLDKQVWFLKRKALPTAAGTLRGGFDIYGYAVYGSLRGGDPVSLNIHGLSIHLATGKLTVHDSEFAQSITSAHRALVGDTLYEVKGAIPFERPMGYLVFNVVQVPGRTAWAEAMDRDGEAIAIRRGLITEVVRGKVRGFTPEELLSGIEIGERRVLLLAEDVEAAGFPLPFRTGGTDKLVVRGKTWNIDDVDDSTFRVAGELMVYDIRASGA